MFLSWERHDQDMALALHLVEVEEETHRCSVCGGDSRECQDPANQYAFETKFRRCYRTRSVAKAAKKRDDSDTDQRATVASTIFHPERVKTNN